MMMRYKRPRSVLPSTCGVPAASPSGALILHDSPVSTKHPISPSVPHRVVLGFDLVGASLDNKPSDLCESPRSVLDRNVLKSSVFRSPRSCLGNLLSSRQEIDIRISTTVVHAPVEGKLNGHDGFATQDRHTQHVPALQNQAELGIQTVQTNPLMKKHFNDEMPFHGHPMQDVEGMDANCKSIFFTASPPPFDISDMRSMNFLDDCCFCRSSLKGKDVFMYRGDQAFCSVECRYQKIFLDERKKREFVTVVATAGHFDPAAPVRHHKF